MYSTKFMNDGSANSQYASSGRYGWYFNLNIPSGYQSTYGNKFQVELFDPSCYDSGTGLQVDEIRDPAVSTGQTTNITTTWYTVQYLNSTTNGQWLNATATNGNMARVSFTGETWAHLQWVNNPNMQIDLSSFPSGTSFRLNATSTDPTVADPVNTTLNGSSENGFNLRVGPPESSGNYTLQSDGVNKVVTMGQNTSTSTGQDAEEHAWATAYGGSSGIQTAASGRMQLNINNTNSVPLNFGSIPSNALGGTFTVTRFDTDVGYTSLDYYDNNTHVTSASNNLVMGSHGDDVLSQDTFTVNQAGAITATYVGGASDTSDWSLAYNGFPGRIALVGQSGLSY
jgi:hypothetical protein